MCPPFLKKTSMLCTDVRPLQRDEWASLRCQNPSWNFVEERLGEIKNIMFMFTNTPSTVPDMLLGSHCHQGPVQ